MHKQISHLHCHLSFKYLCVLKVLDRAGVQGMRNTLKRAHQIDSENAKHIAVTYSHEGKRARMRRKAQRAEGDAARSVGEGITYQSNIGKCRN